MKTKAKEILKTAAVSALALGFFSGVFIGANCVAFAQAARDMTPPTPIEAQAAVSTSAEPLNINERIFNIERVTNWFGYEISQVGASSVSMEEAAETGIGLLERYFEVDLENNTIHMVYFGVEEPTEMAANEFMLGGWREESFWRGIILPTGASLEDSLWAFSFELNGETGEMLGIERSLSADVIFARGMSTQDASALESRLRYENNPYVIVDEIRGVAFLSPDAPLGTSFDPVFEPFTTADSIHYANDAMQIAEAFNLFDSEVARARIMLDNPSAWRVLNANLELEAIVTAHVQCVNGNDVMFTFTMRDKTLVQLDSGRLLTVSTFIGGNDADGNPMETIFEERAQPTRFGWVYR